MDTAKDSTDSVTTSADWPILQIQNWHKCCLAGCLLCYSTSLCFWNYYHFKFHRRTKSTAPPLLTPVFAFKSILQEQPEQQIHFLALVWATVTLSKHPSHQHYQLLWKWETNCVTSWCSFSLNLLVTDLRGRESLNSCLPSHHTTELPQHMEQKRKISLAESCKEETTQLKVQEQQVHPGHSTPAISSRLRLLIISVLDDNAEQS